MYLFPALLVSSRISELLLALVSYHLNLLLLLLFSLSPYFIYFSAASLPASLFFSSSLLGKLVTSEQGNTLKNADTSSSEIGKVDSLASSSWHFPICNSFLILYINLFTCSYWFSWSHKVEKLILQFYNSI